MMFSQASHGSNNSASMKEEDIVQGRGPEDGLSRDGSREDSASGKRKHADRDPESPGQMVVNDVDTAPLAKKERTYFGDMDTDSPASYPKHVLVPASEHDQKQYVPHSTQLSEERIEQVTFPPEPAGQGAQVLTPDSVGRGRAMPNIEPQQYPPRHQQFQHDVYRAPSYTPDMDYGRSYGATSHQRSSLGGPPRGGENYGRPRRWACDFCNVATFLSYEEACAHEEACARRHQDSSHFHDSYQGVRPPTAAYGAPRGHPAAPQGSGLGALYHASQEVVTPPTPYHQQQPTRWGSHAPQLPVLPAEQGYYRQGYYDMREDPAHFHGETHHYPQGNGSFHMAPHPDFYQKRILLAMPTDQDSLSDRQCYVRAEMVEIFAATQKDVSARHSKGAQKLVLGQVGIRCVHCSHLRQRDRAERAVCYPKSISRIYQTVADMQRFHFENCREIPDQVRMIYKKLKTTRPRGVGSPQSYWVSSAKTLGLVDTDSGIRFDADVSKEPPQQQAPQQGQQPPPPPQQQQQQQASPQQQLPADVQPSEVAVHNH